MNVNGVMSGVSDVAVMAVFAGAAVVGWRVYAGRPGRWQVVGASVFVASVSAAGLVLRMSTGGSIPVWFMVMYGLMFLAMAFVVVSNALAIRRGRLELERIRHKRRLHH